MKSYDSDSSVKEYSDEEYPRGMNEASSVNSDYSDYREDIEWSW